jgi:hypothetical protein
MNLNFCIISSLLFISLFYNDNNYYIKNSSFPYKLTVNSIENDFRLLVELIGTCVLNYFYLFKVCYITSIDIILKCITYYFIIFNQLFVYSLDFIRLCIINSYIFSLSMTELLCNYPNNYLIFIYYSSKLYLNNIINT